MDNLPPSQGLCHNVAKSSFHRPPPSGLGSVTSFGRTPSLPPYAPLNSAGHPAPTGTSIGSVEHAQNAGASLTATPTPSSVPAWMADELERTFNQGDVLSTERLVMRCIEMFGKEAVNNLKLQHVGEINGAPFCYDAVSPFFLACQQGITPLVKELYQPGVTLLNEAVSAQGKRDCVVYGKTPLLCALERGHREVAELLTAWGASHEVTVRCQPFNSARVFTVERQKPLESCSVGLSRRPAAGKVPAAKRTSHLAGLSFGNLHESPGLNAGLQRVSGTSSPFNEGRYFGLSSDNGSGSGLDPQDRAGGLSAGLNRFSGSSGLDPQNRFGGLSGGSGLGSSFDPQNYLSGLGSGLSRGGVRRQINYTGLQLLSASAAQGNKRLENCMLSPHGSASLLLMLAQAAGGQLRDKLAAALGDITPIAANYLSCRGVQNTGLKSCNVILLAEHINAKESFLQNPIWPACQAAVERADFRQNDSRLQLIEKVNTHVRSKTEGMIEGILTPADLHEDSFLIMCNTLFFEGQWTRPFKSDRGTFHLPNGQNVEVAMMKKRGLTSSSAGVNYCQSGGWQLVSLPYRGPEQAIVLLPPEGTMPIDVTPQQLDAALTELDDDRRLEKDLNLVMPKFNLSDEIDLQQLIGAILGPEHSHHLDLSELTDAPAVLGCMKQKVVLDVDEKGTRLAAASALGGGLGPSPERCEMIVNRPFLFLVRDKSTKLLLVAAQVADPRS